MFIRKAFIWTKKAFLAFCVLFFFCCLISLSMSPSPITNSVTAIVKLETAPSASFNESVPLIDLGKITSAPPPSASSASADIPLTNRCFRGPICDCQDHGRVCFDSMLKQNLVCSHGIVMATNEPSLYENMLYRNACRPRGMPPLKNCKTGEKCQAQGLKEGQVCVDKGWASLCHCGKVVDFSTPEIRMRLEEDEGCEKLFPNPNDPCIIFL